MITTVYLIEAFRWGALNEHRYVVDVVFLNKTYALKLAKEASENRDHTYGIQVTRFSNEDEQGEKYVVAYFPSKLNEKEPYTNYKKEDMMLLVSDLLSLSEHSLSKLPVWLKKRIIEIKDKKYE